MFCGSVDWMRAASTGPATREVLLDGLRLDVQNITRTAAAIDRPIRDGMKELTTLDAIMHNNYARHPDKLRAWQSASHIQRARNPRRSRPSPVPRPARPRHSPWQRDSRSYDRRALLPSQPSQPGVAG